MRNWYAFLGSNDYIVRVYLLRTGRSLSLRIVDVPHAMCMQMFHRLSFSVPGLATFYLIAILIASSALEFRALTMVNTVCRGFGVR